MTDATYKTVIQIDYPDYASDTVTFFILTDPAPGSGVELIGNKTYTATLDSNGQNLTFELPTPDNTGDLAFSWDVTGPGGGSYEISVAYDASPQSLKSLIASGITLTAPTNVGVPPGDATWLANATAGLVFLTTAYTATGSESAGSLYWDRDAETLTLVINSNVTGQMFEEVWFPVQNNSGADIGDGVPVMFAGTLGNSGKILIQKAIADGSIDPSYILGLTTEPIANGATGKVTWFGKVRGVQTDGANYSESWSDGEIIYVSATTAGNLTKTVPNAPNYMIQVCAVINAHGTNGTYFVRPTWNPRIRDLADVDGAAPTITGQEITWDNANSYWTVTNPGASVGGAGATVSDQQLRNWAMALPGLLTNVTRTDYSQTFTDVNGLTQYTGWIQVTGTVTYPDASTGHMDGVEDPETGFLRYYTASHTDSGKIMVVDDVADGATGVTIVTPDYYVDSNAAAGGDGSLATPWDALSDLPSLSDGDIVALKSGSTFEGQITTTDNVEIYRYASGNKPIIDASDAETGWSKTVGQTNVYEASVTFDEHPTGAQEIMAFEDGTRLTRVADVATCDSTAGSYVPSSDTSSPATLYIHTTNSDNPATNGSEYRYSVRVYCIAETDQLGSDGVTVDGVHCRRASGNGGSIRVNRSAVIRHVQIDEGNKHNIYAADGSSIGGVFTEGYSTLTTSTTIVFNENTPSDLGIAVKDAAITNTAYQSTSAAIFSHNNVSGDFGTATIKRVYITNHGSGAEMEDVTSLVFDNNYQNDGSFMVRTGSAVTHTMRICRMIASQNGAFMAKTNIDGSTIKIFSSYGSTSGNTTTGFIGITNSSTSLLVQSTHLEKTNATNPRDAIYVSSGKTGVTVTALRNKYTGWLRFVNLQEATVTLASNNNQFCADGRNYVNGVDHLTIAAYQAATSQDLASIVGGCI